jgi:imidazolonepropionase-like amidohydrolase
MTRKIITAKGLVDVDKETVLPNPFVIMEEDRITKIGQQSEMPCIDQDAEILDLTDKFILPGLINCHAHICLPGTNSTMPAFLNYPYEIKVLCAANNARAELLSGVTMVRDCGGPGTLVQRIDAAVKQGKIQGPRIYNCGSMLTMTGGHAHDIGVEADGPGEIIKAVREQLKLGADFIKLMATGGSSPGTFPGHASYSVSELRAAVETAHRVDKTVATHCRGIPGIKNSIKAGVDFIEHACFELPDGRLEFDAKLADDIAAAGSIVVPTIRLYKDHVINLERKKKKNKDWTPEDEKMLDLMPRSLEEKIKSLEGLLGAGVTCLAGNDAGLPNTGFGLLWQELEIMTEGGMTAMQAIVSATKNAARALGLDDEIGSIQEGKQADIIAVDGDPTERIAHLNNVVFIMKAGNVYGSSV